MDRLVCARSSGSEGSVLEKEGPILTFDFSCQKSSKIDKKSGCGAEDTLKSRVCLLKSMSQHSQPRSFHPNCHHHQGSYNHHSEMPPKSSAKEAARREARRLVQSQVAKQPRRGSAARALQAVVLADAFSKRLDPLTTDRPACLLPLCNVPLLDWTLENLALAEVEEIFILASRYSDQIKKHLATSPARYSLPKITVIATLMRNRLEM